MGNHYCKVAIYGSHIIYLYNVMLTYFIKSYKVYEDSPNSQIGITPMVEDVGQDADLFPDGIPLFVYTDLEVDDNGILKLDIELDIEGEEDIIISKGFYEIVDEAKDNLCEQENYNGLYSLAAELTKEAERLREEADKIENSTRSVADLFNANGST